MMKSLSFCQRNNLPENYEITIPVYIGQDRFDEIPGNLMLYLEAG